MENNQEDIGDYFSCFRRFMITPNPNPNYFDILDDFKLAHVFSFVDDVFGKLALQQTSRRCNNVLEFLSTESADETKLNVRIKCIPNDMSTLTLGNKMLTSVNGKKFKDIERATEIVKGRVRVPYLARVPQFFGKFYP